MTIERLPVEKNCATRWWTLAANGFQQGAFARTACPHDTDHLSSGYREGEAVQGHITRFETKRQIPNLEVPDDIPFFFDDSLREIASQNLPGIDADDIAVDQVRRITDDRFTDHDRAIRLQYLQRADSPIVVAGDLQQNFAAGARAQQNVVFFQQRSIV